MKEESPSTTYFQKGSVLDGELDGRGGAQTPDASIAILLAFRIAYRIVTTQRKALTETSTNAC